MITLAAHECRRQLRYNYLDAERIEKAKGLAEALNRYASTEAELARVKKDYASRMDTIQAEIDLLNGCVLSGYELREYLCYWSYDEPKTGRKTLRKREGNEVVAEEDMTERDRQMVMDIIDAVDREEAAKDSAIPVLALCAPKDWPETLDDLKTRPVGPEESWIIDTVNDLFADIGEAVLPREAVIERMRELINTTHESELRRMLAFIDDRNLAGCVGWSFVRLGVFNYIEAEKAKAAAKKTNARKGRRAAGSGTVDLPSDEGSRDDAGSDSKNNL